MLENCCDLAECEAVLIQEVRRVMLLGEIPLSTQDLHLLTSLIRETIAEDVPKGTRLIKQSAPTCMAVFMVWMGIDSYRDGDYWTPVAQSIGLVDRNWQARWGRIFIAFLKSRNLPQFDIDRGHAYVTQILIHGGIPNSCLDEFFERVLDPLARREVEDPANPQAVRHYVRIRREDNEARTAFDAQQSALFNRQQELSNKVHLLRASAQAFDDIRRLWQAEISARDWELVADLPLDFEAYREQKLRHVQELKEAIGELESRETEYRECQTSFTDGHRRALTHREAIEKIQAEAATLAEQRRSIADQKERGAQLANQLAASWARISTQPWREEYENLLVQVPMHQVSSTIDKLRTLLSLIDIARQAQPPLGSARRNRLQRLWGIVGGLATLVALVLFALEVGHAGIQNLVFPGVGFLALAAISLWLSSRAGAAVRLREEADRAHLGDLERQVETAGQELIRQMENLPISIGNPEVFVAELVPTLDSTLKACQQLRAARDLRQRQEQVVDQLSLEAEQLAAQLGLPASGALPSQLDSLGEMLEQASRRQEAAAEATRALDEDIVPRLRLLRTDYQAVLSELGHVKRRYESLGGGHPDAGIRRVQDVVQCRELAQRLRTQLAERHPDLAALEQEVRRANDKAQLESEQRELNEQLAQIRVKLQELAEQSAYFPSVYVGIDEPIRRYVLYGGQSAEDFLVQACLMMHTALTTGVAPEASALRLPERVVEKFELWWSEHRLAGAAPPEVISQDHGQVFRTPSLLLAPNTEEIMVSVRPQVLLMSAQIPEMSFDILHTEAPTEGRSYPLRLYQAGENLVETQRLEFPLPFPQGTYRFQLRSGGSALQEWIIPATSPDQTYYAFEGRSRRLIQGEAMPRSSLWLVLRKEYTPEPVECVRFEGGSLHGAWRSYKLWQLDLQNADELKLTSGRTRHSLSFPITAGAPSTLELVGGRHVPNVNSEGMDAYAGELPSIRLPIQDVSELRHWHLSIGPVGPSLLVERRYFRLSEITQALDLHMDEGWTDVALTNDAILGASTWGGCDCRVYRAPYTDWRASFCVLPSIDVSFTRSVYLPHDPDVAPHFEAKLITPAGVVYQPAPPAKLINSRDEWHLVSGEASQSAIEGKLSCPRPDGQALQIPLSIPIPKIRWRLQGMERGEYSTWQDIVDEVWIGDPGQERFLVIETPSFLEGERLTVQLRERASKLETQAVKDGLARFALQAFAEPLRTGPPIQTLVASLDGSDPHPRIDDAPLLKVRTRWQADNLECLQTIQGGNIVLQLEWNEAGRADQKAIRLWSLAPPSSQPVQQVVVGREARSAMLEIPAGKVSPGPYLLHLEPCDPWSTSAPAYPGAEAPNSIRIQIVSSADLRKGQILEIESVEATPGKPRRLAYRYRLRIQGKIVNRKLPFSAGAEHVLVTVANEGWYAAHIQVYGEAELQADIEGANPVKIDYVASKDVIGAIEDKYGDGAMYCDNCRLLYWSRERLEDEARRKHHLFGPVEVFRLTWDPQHI